MITVSVEPPSGHRHARVLVETRKGTEAMSPEVAAEIGRQMIEAAKEASMRDAGWVPS